MNSVTSPLQLLGAAPRFVGRPNLRDTWDFRFRQSLRCRRPAGRPWYEHSAERRRWIEDSDGVGVDRNHARRTGVPTVGQTVDGGHRPCCSWRRCTLPDGDLGFVENTGTPQCKHTERHREHQHSQSGPHTAIVWWARCDAVKHPDQRRAACEKPLFDLAQSISFIVAEQSAPPGLPRRGLGAGTTTFYIVSR